MPQRPSSAGRPRALTTLLILFVWIDARALGTLLLPERGAGVHLHRALGIGWVHFVAGAVVVACAIVATGLLWRPTRGWFEASMTALAVYATQIVVSTALMVRHPALAREAALLSREARGIPTRPEALDAVTQPGFLWGASGVVLALLAGAAVLAWRHRFSTLADDARA